MIIGAFVAVAIFTASRTSADGARNKLEAQGAEQLARDAGTMLASIYSSGVSGEFDGFVPSEAVLRRHATEVGGGVVLNSSLAAGSGLNVVDTTRVPANGRATVTQSLRDGRTGYWQVLAARLPTWGSTPGGRISVFVRAWTAGTDGHTTKPLVYRLEFRPTWFADYQMLFDGPFQLASSARLNGRVHSNGYRASFYNQYDALYDSGVAINFSAGATCVGNARVSTSEKRIDGPGIGGCPAANQVAGTVPRINLLRAQSAAARIRTMCGQTLDGITLVCPPGSAETSVSLQGTRVVVNGAGYEATVEGDKPGDRQGVVVLASGDIGLSGSFAAGSNARALVVASADPSTTKFGTGRAASIWVRSAGDVGAPAGSKASSVGIVAEGDVIFDERTACPIVARGAFVAMSGMMSIHPTWRTPLPAPHDASGPPECNDPRGATIEGSIVSHFPPGLVQANNQAGYPAGRNYAYLGSLYDNPPPMYPTAADWSMTSMSPANLDCFANGRLQGCT